MIKNILLFMIITILWARVSFAQTKDFTYAPTFRYCPDRDYDLAWENDLVAFRIYGKQPNANSGLSGIDVWHKKVSYPIVDKWYREHLEGKVII